MAAAPKTVRTGKSVRAFLDAVPSETRRREGHLVAKLLGKLSGERAEMWGPSIVGFGTQLWVGASGKGAEWPRFAFSPRKEALVLYIFPAFRDRDALLAKLGKHSIGKSCLYIRRLDDVHLPTLRKLLVSSTRAASAADTNYSAT